jgi:hypothetical protein
MYAMGVSRDHTPFSFGGERYQLIFDWTIVENTNVATLASVFYKVLLVFLEFRFIN